MSCVLHVVAAFRHFSGPIFGFAKIVDDDRCYHSLYSPSEITANMFPILVWTLDIRPAFVRICICIILRVFVALRFASLRSSLLCSSPALPVVILTAERSIQRPPVNIYVVCEWTIWPESTLGKKMLESSRDNSVALLFFVFLSHELVAATTYYNSPWSQLSTSTYVDRGGTCPIKCTRLYVRHTGTWFPMISVRLQTAVPGVDLLQVPVHLQSVICHPPSLLLCLVSVRLSYHVSYVIADISRGGKGVRHD